MSKAKPSRQMAHTVTLHAIQRSDATRGLTKSAGDGIAIERLLSCLVEYNNAHPDRVHLAVVRAGLLAARCRAILGSVRRGSNRRGKENPDESGSRRHSGHRLYS